ncbi:penicillin-binding protein 1A [Bdellovibrio sp. qaytius]|nr:penicillin-binding protein 1A [Bdellovibrio sp. qaytius]
MLKKILLGLFAFIFLSTTGAYFVYRSVKASLPEVIKLEDYKPLLVSQVFDRNGKKIGEFSRQRRVLIPYKDIPELVIKSFIAAEDDTFFEHKGINLQALLRAFIANMRAGRNVQGGSTITQQVAKTLILQTNEKTFSRKLRDILLALQMEENLSKGDILYLYLNQIYFGQSAYGIEMASQTYFRKPAKNLTIPEAAMLAGLPKAPSDYSPVKNPIRAKERQVYVIHRLHEIGYITKAQADEYVKTPVKVYLKEEYEILAPFYLETLRQLLVQQLGEDVILNQGVRITTGLDLNKQIAANEAVVRGLKELDKRQGYRGPLKVLEHETEYAEFLEKEKKSIITDSNPERTIMPDGTFAEVDIIKKGRIITKKVDEKAPITNLPSYLDVGKNYDAIVTNVNDAEAYVEVQLPEAKGIIELESMTWARKVNFEQKSEGNEIKKPSTALKKGDVIYVKILDDKFTWRKTRGKNIPKLDISKHLALELDQEPLVEGSLLSIDQQTQDVLAMVGGYSFVRNEYNRALQAARQTGSSFKAIVYAAALEKGYNASTKIIDAPLVYKENSGGEEGQGDEKTWKPSNHGKEFSGEITMRNALVKSLNIPSVKIVEDIGVNFATDFAQRLGIFSKLNQDYTLVLGSSSVTLYEMTKVFSQLGRLGKRTRPMIVRKVIDTKGKVLLENLSLDTRFANEMAPIEEKFAQKRKEFESKDKDAENTPASPFFFDDPDQLIRPEVAATITQMLRGTVEDPSGTGGRAAQLGREVAGKTGTTNGYVDAWFIAFTPQIATGVWVGFDKEQTIGRGEVGGKSALPIWLDYMKSAHKDLPPMSFPIPDGVKIVKVDAESGKLANSASSRTIMQAYIEGTEPTAAESRSEETTDYLKRDIEE